MTTKETFFVKLWRDNAPHIYGLGEVALFRGLSAEDTPEFESVLADFCRRINAMPEGAPIYVPRMSSMHFGFETALRDLTYGGRMHVFDQEWDSDARHEIPINGLVWMGSEEEMLARINDKLASGFRCVKLKIGGIDFARELELLGYIRSVFSASDLELRLDANGAFKPGDALKRLDALSRYDIHSIEQPVRAGQWNAMSEICRHSPIPVALDEELIGLLDDSEAERMLDIVMPQYIILKPSLHGGFRLCENRVAMARDRGIGWWATSALESNVGLNAIAQWTATMNTGDTVQGLGTGNLYTDNIDSPLVQERDILRYDTQHRWRLPRFEWNFD